MSLPLWHPKGCARPGQSQQPQPGTGDATWHVGSQHSPPGKLQGLKQPQDRWEAGASPSSPRGCWHCLPPSTGTSAPSSQAGQWAGFGPGTRAGDSGAGGQVALDPKEGLGKWRQQGEADGSGLWLISIPWRGEEPAGGIDTCPPPQAQDRQDKVGTPNTPRVVSAWRQQQDTQRREKGAPGDLPAAGTAPSPKAAFCYHPPPPPPNADPWLALGSPSFPTAHRAQFNNSTIP